MAVRSFHSLKALATHFDGHVYGDSLDDSLLVNDVLNSCWHRYAWTHGKREIKFVETITGELPLIVQIYPAL